MRPLRSVALALGIAWGLAASATASPCRADDPNGRAEALFERGRKLLREGHIADACAAFAESDRIDPGVGTQMNLGDCYERNGQTASAWATFRGAARLASSLGQTERAKVSNGRADVLEPRLSRVTIHIAESIPGLVVIRDGNPLRDGALDVGTPVDPGFHVYVARAPGRKPFRAEVSITGDAQSNVVVVPVLEPEEGAGGASATTTPREEPPISSLRTVGLVTGGVGLLALVATGVFGAIALDDRNTTNNRCPLQNGNVCDDAIGLAANSRSHSMAALATGSFIVGAVATATGASLYFLGPRAPAKTSLRVTPAVAAQGAGLFVTQPW
jgi:hypothetical protein